MKILQLIPRFVFPPDDGGKIGIANIFMEFSKQNCDVTLFSYYNEPVPDSAIKEAEKYGKVILFKQDTRNSPLKIAGSLFSSEPLFISKNISKKAKAFISELVKNEHFDVIHADHSSMAPLALYAKSICGAPVGLRQHNIEWMIWGRYAESLPKYHPKRLYLARQASLLKSAEKKIFSDVDINFSITKPDLVRAKELAPKGNYTIATAGVNPKVWQPDDNIARIATNLILATTYRWVHNVDAVRWLVSQVMPLIRKKIPQCRLLLTGKDIPDWLKDYHFIEPLGYVERVQPYLNKSGVYVAPLFVGGGIRIKILEAMAMKLPVVATSIAAEGIEATERDGLFIADNAEAFAERVIAHCSDNELARISGESARKFILREHSWERSVRIMIEEYGKLIRI